MSDKNRYTTMLFTLGLLCLPIFAFALIQGTDEWKMLLAMTLVTIIYEIMPIQLPNGIYYSISTLGTVYVIYHFGFIASAIPTLISSVIFFALYAKSFRNINWFRTIVTFAMYMVGSAVTYLVSELIDTSLFYMELFLLVFVFDLTNLLLRKGIEVSLGGSIGFRNIRPTTLMNYTLPIVICSFVLVELSIQESFAEWLWTLIFTTFFAIVIYHLTKAARQQYLAVEENSQRFKSLYEHNPDIVITADDQGRILAANPRLKDILEYETDRLLGTDLFSLLPEDAVSQARSQYEEVLKGNPVSWVSNMIRGDGDIRQFSITCIPTIVNQKIVGSYIICKDITAEKEAERAIEKMAYYDSITGLSNRILLMDRLHQEIRKSEDSGLPIAVFYMDIDQFKTVNDTLGHSMGDLMLIKVAQKILESSPPNALVSRLGGDEFAIMIPETDAEKSAEYAKEMLDAFTSPVVIGEHVLFISPSIGISLYPEHGKSAEQLLTLADTAMYRVKNNGGGGYRFFTPDLQKEHEEMQLMSMLLRRSLENEELWLQYQPRLDLRTGEIIGAEALLRWTNPLLGEVPPSTFIPIAERNRLILNIGAWVLKEACKQNKRWQDMGFPPIKISVNISSIQLQQDQFIDTVCSALEESGLEARWLELELTESVLIQNTDRNLQIIEELKRLGVSIAIDDFGVGYSSLSYLNRFSLDALKIDQSFIKNIGINDIDEMIIRSIIGLAQKLNMHVIAEGIETPEQLAFIQAEQCDEVQGYLVGHPMLADQFVEQIWKRDLQGQTLLSHLQKFT